MRLRTEQRDGLVVSTFAQGDGEVSGTAIEMGVAHCFDPYFAQIDEGLKGLYATGLFQALPQPSLRVKRRTLTAEDRLTAIGPAANAMPSAVAPASVMVVVMRIGAASWAVAGAAFGGRLKGVAAGAGLAGLLLGLAALRLRS